ncbi:MAG: AzlC family ABC transporter permease [Acidaminococcaceae bacterium]
MEYEQATLQGSKIKTEHREFYQGAIATGPILLGLIPFGVTCGLMGITAGLTQVETVVMSLLVFAGASQFVAITMLAGGITSWFVLAMTTLLINLRHILMGASLAQYMLKQTLPQQMLLSFLLTDEAYALTTSRIYQKGYSAAYHLGASLSLYFFWVLSTLAGVFAGSYIPDPLSWGLDFAMPATFLVLLFPRLRCRISIIVCIVSAILAVAGSLWLPGKWYMITACIGASLIGGLLEGVNEYEE